MDLSDCNRAWIHPEARTRTYCISDSCPFWRTKALFNKLQKIMLTFQNNTNFIK